VSAKPYQVHLELFEGPLDLLLYLIKKNDLEITDIPLSEITKEYLSYLDLMRELNLEVAGEFLVTASTLMQIKARTLLPSQPDADEGPDPAQELVNKLQEYQKFKSAAGFLSGQADFYKDVYYRGAPKFRSDEKTLDASLFDIMAAVRDALARVPAARGIPAEEYPIEAKMEKILFLLETQPRLPLAELFADERRRGGVLACFLAMLELIKQRKIVARQEKVFGSVYVFKRINEEPAVEAAPQAPAEPLPAPPLPPDSPEPEAPETL
jgi:segregation and condensation protein A